MIEEGYWRCLINQSTVRKEYKHIIKTKLDAILHGKCNNTILYSINFLMEDSYESFPQVRQGGRYLLCLKNLLESANYIKNQIPFCTENLLCLDKDSKLVFNRTVLMKSFLVTHVYRLLFRRTVLMKSCLVTHVYKITFNRTVFGELMSSDSNIF